MSNDANRARIRSNDHQAEKERFVCYNFNNLWKRKNTLKYTKYSDNISDRNVYIYIQKIIIFIQGLNKAVPIRGKNVAKTNKYKRTISMDDRERGSHARGVCPI